MEMTYFFSSRRNLSNANKINSNKQKIKIRLKIRLKRNLIKFRIQICKINSSKFQTTNQNKIIKPTSTCLMSRRNKLKENSQLIKFRTLKMHIKIKMLIWSKNMKNLFRAMNTQMKSK